MGFGCGKFAGGDGRGFGILGREQSGAMNPEPSVAGVLFAQLPEPVFCLMEGLEGVIWAGTQGGLVFAGGGRGATDD